MNKLVQEKYQSDYPNPADKDPGPWASAASARRSKRELQTRASSGLYESYGSGLNDLAPGMAIDRQNLSDIPEMRTVTGGTDDVTDNPSGGDWGKGYVPLKMRPTDDQFTREHNDAFYDEITVDGQTGFLERNNVLDRS